MSDLPKRTVRITDLERLETPVKIDSKQELLIPVASNATQKDTFSMPINSFVEWLLEKHTVNKDLTNLSDVGQAVLDAKRDYFNNVAEDTDINTFVKDGVYKVSATGDVEIHAPTNASGYYIITVDSDDEGTIEQQGRNLYISPENIYQRQRINGTWTNWKLIQQDMSNPSFETAPTVLNEGINADQLATIGQLDGKFADIFKTEYHITEGLIVSGNIDYSAGVLTVSAGAKYITNNSESFTVADDITENIPETGNYYVFIDNSGIRYWSDFQKVYIDGRVLESGVLYYNIATDTYSDENGRYSLAPIGSISNGIFTPRGAIQFFNIENLMTLINGVYVSGKVDIQLGDNEQNSYISSETDYERHIVAGHYSGDSETGEYRISYGAGLDVYSHSENDNEELIKDPTSTLYVKDDAKETRITLTPDSAKLITPRLDSESEIATMADLDEIKQTSLTFIGYVSTSEPTGYTFKIGNKWVNANEMPTEFPITGVKTWNGSAWVDGDDFTPVDFDFFRNINDNEGYYWFGGAWKIMSTDMDTDYFVLGNDGKWKIKDDVNLPGATTTVTANTGDNSTRIATTEFVQTAIASHGGGGSGSGRNIGDIFYTTRKDTALAGAVECNGATYETTDFTGEGSIGELLELGVLPYISLTDYQNAVSTIGIVGVFGWDGEGTTTFRVPKLANIFIEAGTASVLGNYIPAGLPNITGDMSYSDLGLGSTSGAFTNSGSGRGIPSGHTGSSAKNIGFDASRSNSIYGNSNTVQPNAVKYRAMVQLVTGATDEAVATVGTVVAQVGELNSRTSGIIDYIVRFQQPNADNNYTYVREYKSGWIEQGGVITVNATATGVVVTFPVEMMDANYSAIATASEYATAAQGYDVGVRVKGKTTTGMSIIGNAGAVSYYGEPASWEVKGFKKTN